MNYQSNISHKNKHKNAALNTDEDWDKIITEMKNKCFEEKNVENSNKKVEDVEGQGFLVNKHKKFACNFNNCKALLSSKKSLKRHINGVHLNIKPYKCTMCDLSFAQIWSLEYHKNTKHFFIRPFRCDFCGKHFAMKSNMSFHVRTVHKTKENRCEKIACNFNECKVLLSSKISLKRHIDGVHLKKKPYKCTMCDLSFARNGHLKRHKEAVHLGLRPYKCPKCNLSFVRKSHLDCHYNAIHATVKPYECGLCSKKFPKKCQRNDHIKKIHETVNAFKCSQCSASYQHKHNLEQHVSEIHLNLRPFSCNPCSQSFASEHGLNHHNEERITRLTFGWRVTCLKLAHVVLEKNV